LSIAILFAWTPNLLAALGTPAAIAKFIGRTIRILDTAHHTVAIKAIKTVIAIDVFQTHSGCFAATVVATQSVARTAIIIGTSVGACLGHADAIASTIDVSIALSWLDTQCRLFIAGLGTGTGHVRTSCCAATLDTGPTWVAVTCIDTGWAFDTQTRVLIALTGAEAVIV